MNCPPPAFVFLAATLSICPLSAGELSRGKETLPPAPPDSEAERSRFHIGAGAGYRSIGDVKFSTGSQARGLRLPFPSIVRGGAVTAIGNVASYSDRSYFDGYVNQDGGTLTDGSTWFWGYENASQISGAGAGRTLSFHSQAPAEIQSAGSRSDSDPGSWGTDGDGAVPVIQFAWEYDILPAFSVGASLQYSFLQFDGEQNLHTFSASRTRFSQEINVTDSFTTGDIIIPLAPYKNGLEGPGPVISNTPSNRTYTKGDILGRTRLTYFNRIEESLDVRLHNVDLGPTATARLGPVDLAFSAGLSLNIADWEASHTETVYVRGDRQATRIYKRWSDHRSDTEVLPGVYARLAASVSLTKSLSFAAYGNHNWSRTLTGRVGPSEFSIDPSGWTVGGMLDFSF